MLETAGIVLLRVTRLCAWAAVACLIAGMSATVADIVARKTVGYTFSGTIDVVQLAVMAAVYLSIPHTFMTRSHVAVAILADRMPRRLQAASQALAGLLASGLMAAIAWFGLQQALRQIEYGDISQTLGIPLLWYWAPLLAGAALSALVALLLAAEAAALAIAGRRIPLDGSGGGA